MTTFCNTETGKAELAPGCGAGKGGGGSKDFLQTPWIHQGLDTVQAAGPNDGNTAGTRGHRLLRETETPRARGCKYSSGNSLFSDHFAVLSCFLLLLKE